MAAAKHLVTNDFLMIFQAEKDSGIVANFYPSITSTSCVLEANQRYQLWSGELGNVRRRCERRKEIVICIWVVFRRKGAGKRAMVERLLIIPFLSSFYKSPWETCFSRGAEFGASRLLLLKWSLRQFWAGEMATLLGDGGPARPRRSARFKIILVWPSALPAAKDGKVLRFFHPNINKQKQSSFQLFFFAEFCRGKSCQNSVSLAVNSTDAPLIWRKKQQLQNYLKEDRHSNNKPINTKCWTFSTVRRLAQVWQVLK